MTAASINRLAKINNSLTKEKFNQLGYYSITITVYPEIIIKQTEQGQEVHETLDILTIRADKPSTSYPIIFRFLFNDTTLRMLENHFDDIVSI